uniref:NADH dehydrogenase subunit 4L n=1 Tax=Cryptonema producta TaxID=870231 RepID=UPI0022370B2B|nr:NADH dehydrogenase subunit 4L [Cryptonema producta]UYR95078.1 NADH dehydrogenase subunit 4L [Cryptonema producta]
MKVGVSVWLYLFSYSVFMILVEEKHFMNILILFNMLVSSIFGFCIFSGLMAENLMVGYLAITILCVDVMDIVMGLSLLVNTSRFSSKMSVKPFSFMNF